MDGKSAASAVKDWLAREKLESREVTDAQALIHLHVKYPPTKQGHVFNVVIPKNRDLVLIYSITRVDEGQQNEMRDHGKEDPDAWEKWLHDTRIQLTRSNLDWVLHVGKPKDGLPGPLQAFNLSRPIWFDGLRPSNHIGLDRLNACSGPGNSSFGLPTWRTQSRLERVNCILVS